MFSLRDGRLHRQGQPFFSVGFNYHPSPTGCQYWQRWDAARIEEDLRKMANLGFNTVRFFLFWADFEPHPGEYDAAKTAHLREFVAIAREHQIQCIPALLTIWMNGQLFDPPWRQGRDLWGDPEMVARERAYVQHVARALRDTDNILAYDLGDEVIHVDYAQSRMLPRATVQGWWRSLADAIRQVHPGALVFQANEASAVVGDHQFRPENAEALDLLGLHGFPVWSPFAIEAIAGYKASSFVPFLTKFGRMHGPVLVDELGSYGCDEETARDYLRATAHSALVNGACGIIVWCWQDFATTEKPYALRPGERFAGLIRVDGQPKPAMDVLRSFARSATGQWSSFTIPPAPVGVYVPERHGESDASYLQSGKPTAPAAFYAYLLLKRAHLPFEFTRGPLNSYQFVICPSVQHLSLHEQEQLQEYVARGGVLYYSCADYLHGFGGEALFGVQLRDFTLQVEEMNHFSWQGQAYPVEWASSDKGPVQIPIVKSTAADVLATYPNGSPALTCHAHGRGRAYYLNAPLELQLNAPYKLSSVAWQTIYDRIACAANVQPELGADDPNIEVVVLHDGHRRCGVAINHAPWPVEATVSRADMPGKPSLREKVRLEAKGVHTMLWEV